MKFRYDDDKHSIYAGRDILRERGIRVGNDLTRRQREKLKAVKQTGRLGSCARRRISHLVSCTGRRISRLVPCARRRISRLVSCAGRRISVLSIYFTCVRQPGINVVFNQSRRDEK